MDSSNRLYYTRAAKEWTQALPVGNGHLGGMIYGGAARERVALNHDELWSGVPRDKTVPGAAEIYRQARELALAGKLREATALLESDGFHSGGSDAYLPLGELRIEFGGRGAASGYKRGLDLRTATAWAEYRRGGVRFRRSSFASFPAQLLVYQIRADAPFDCKISMQSPLKSAAGAENGLLLLRGECPGTYKSNKEHRDGDAYVYSAAPEERGIRFLAGLRPITDGEAVVGGGALEIRGATELTLYFACETSFNGWEKHPFLEGKEYEAPVLERLADPEYDRIYAEHLADYRELYGRVALELGSGSDEATDTRLVNYQRKGGDPALCALLYNFGRYLAIAGSRPGSQPMNLQGVWNDQTEPPWNSNYTININTEMNYWPVLGAAMPELGEPLIEMLRALAVSGEKTARAHYGAPGWCAHHNTDLWRFTAPAPGSAVWAFFPMAGAWLARHLWEHYRYTLDRSFLRGAAYPILKQAAAFALSQLVEDKDGWLIMAPSTSPENHFIYEGTRTPVAQTSTCAMAIIKDLFENLQKCHKALGIEDGFSREIAEALPRLLPFRVGSRGQLLEWYEEFEEAEPQHRHVSHLLALHPARLIDPERTPALARAARRTLELRGDAGTGWSLGWKINFWARLRDGDHALRLIDLQLCPTGDTGFNMSNGGGTYPNLFDAHPPFQIDGNFGFVSGINEMLLQSPEDDVLLLLPALPGKWQSGSVRGLAAPGNRRVDIAWENGRLAEWNVAGDTAGLQVFYNGERVEPCE
jgi:alpha-L-fucosidase 2